MGFLKNFVLFVFFIAMRPIVMSYRLRMDEKHHCLLIEEELRICLIPWAATEFRGFDTMVFLKNFVTLLCLFKFVDFPSPFVTKKRSRCC